MGDLLAPFALVRIAVPSMVEGFAEYVLRVLRQMPASRLGKCVVRCVGHDRKFSVPPCHSVTMRETAERL